MHAKIQNFSCLIKMTFFAPSTTFVLQYPDRVFHRILINYGKLKSRMVAL